MKLTAVVVLALIISGCGAMNVPSSAPSRPIHRFPGPLPPSCFPGNKKCPRPRHT
jgi:hypothetical protein